MEKADKRKIVLIGTGMVGMSYAYALLNQNLYNYLSNFPHFIGFPACPLVK